MSCRSHGSDKTTSFPGAHFVVAMIEAAVDSALALFLQAKITSPTAGFAASAVTQCIPKPWVQPVTM